MKKTNTEIEDIKLFETLFILYKCKQTINNLWNIVTRENKILKGIKHEETAILYHIILEVVNFNDEYNTYFNPKYFINYKERILSIKEINKPIIKKINEWKLKEFRNNIIAHPWRKDGKFTHPDSLIYNVPKNILEFSLLINYINYSFILIENEFKTEIHEAIQYMLSISEIQKNEKDYSNLNNEQINLVENVNLKCKKLNKNYQLSVYLYDFSDIK